VFERIEGPDHGLAVPPQLVPEGLVAVLGRIVDWFFTRIIHEASTTAADPAMSTALRSVGFLDVLSSTPAGSSRRAPCSHARLRRLATNLHE